MQFGYVTNGFAHHRLEDALAVLAAIGYRSVGLTLDVNHLDPVHARPRDVRAVARLLAKHRLHPVIETGARYVLDPHRKHYPNLCSPTKFERNRRLWFYKRCIHIAADLGASVLSLWSGIARREDNARRDAPAFEGLRAGLAELCNAAERHQIVIGFEPEPGMLIATTRDYDRLSAALPHPALKLTLDLGHLHCLNETAYPAIFQKYRDRLVNVHIEDMKKGVHEHLMFGDGEMKFPPILRALHASGYRGPINVELSRHSVTAPESAAQAFAFLKKAAANVR
ncbi:MAG TPA: sugar phosphate isomerase/epimerase family protein [Planctomycetota bacterium]|nr:sugar phosphate isomerase/epimerase family protein [Planctomycetota bacterium]